MKIEKAEIEEINEILGFSQGWEVFEHYLTVAKISENPRGIRAGVALDLEDVRDED